MVFRQSDPSPTRINFILPLCFLYVHYPSILYAFIIIISTNLNFLYSFYLHIFSIVNGFVSIWGVPLCFIFSFICRFFQIGTHPSCFSCMFIGVKLVELTI
ncbi:hypothetical protein LINPERPRIM_LOCUS20342 [Linum perenne]